MSIKSIARAKNYTVEFIVVVQPNRSIGVFRHLRISLFWVSNCAFALVTKRHC